jgi:ferrous iron transport protein A
LQSLFGCASALSVTLDQLPIGVPARITRIDWAQLVPEEAQRLRAMGVDVGAEVRLSYRGVFFGRDPIALEIGRMTLALRRVHARAMEVEPVPVEAAA